MTALLDIDINDDIHALCEGFIATSPRQHHRVLVAALRGGAGAVVSHAREHRHQTRRDGVGVTLFAENWLTRFGLS